MEFLYNELRFPCPWRSSLSTHDTRISNITGTRSREPTSWRFLQRWLGLRKARPWSQPCKQQRTKRLQNDYSLKYDLSFSQLDTRAVVSGTIRSLTGQPTLKPLTLLFCYCGILFGFVCGTVLRLATSPNRKEYDRSDRVSHLAVSFFLMTLGLVIGTVATIKKPLSVPTGCKYGILFNLVAFLITCFASLEEVLFFLGVFGWSITKEHVYIMLCFFLSGVKIRTGNRLSHLLGCSTGTF